EAHDVDAVLAQSGTDRRSRVRLARGDLELDLPHDFLCHGSLLRGSSDRVTGLPQSLHFLDLHEVELDRGGPAEDRYEHPKPALLGADLLHGSVESGEGAVD